MPRQLPDPETESDTDDAGSGEDTGRDSSAVPAPAGSAGDRATHGSRGA
ncbi:hypothetical protein O1M54_46100 [Streptomyces diastatochromogenes]|nr:hypothetical protein [Streptomyces diastatochromogenes]